MKKILFCLLATACAEIQDLDNHPTEAAFSYEIVEGSQINQFKVNLRMPKASQTLVRKNSEGKVDFEFSVADFYQDNQVQAGKSYTYHLGFINKGRFQEEQQLHVRIPFDLYLDGKWEVNAETESLLKNLRRVKLSKNALILTNGRDVQLNIEEFISDGGTIQTHAFSSVAPDLQNGASGGRVRLNIMSGQGVLKINLVGQRGGKGPNGPRDDNHPGKPGYRGLKGGDAGRLFIQNAAQVKLDIQQFPGAGGAGGDGGIGKIKRTCGRAEFGECIYTTDYGPQGPNGESGLLGKICEEKEADCD